MNELKFLADAAHLLIQHSPQISQELMQKVAVVAYEKEITLHSSVNNKICRKCFLLLIPPVTCVVTTHHQRLKSIVRYHCGCCGTTKDVCSWKPRTKLAPNVVLPAVTKQPKKKKKRTDLNALLQKKKEKPTDDQKLNLMDFLLQL